VERLSRETPAHYIAFDLLGWGDHDLRERPFAARRAALVELLGDARAPLHISPSTDDVSLASHWLELDGGGIDGVVVKRCDQPYRSGERTMVKVKHERTIDCVVAGFRLWGEQPVVGSLLLGLYDERRELRHVGVCSAFSQARRLELLSELRPYATSLQGHPWEQGFLLGGGPTGRLRGAAGRWDAAEMELDWMPLRPELVCEVAYDHVDLDRFRHPARFRRWRPDRDARSCLLEQLKPPSPEPLQLLASS
jgi:ATP-dependent DNA ligase